MEKSSGTFIALRGEDTIRGTYIAPMPRYLLWLLLASSTPVLAQAPSVAWYGAVGGGLVAFDNGAFSDRLQSYIPSGANGESIVYSTPDFPMNGYTLDGSAALVPGGRFTIGVSGQMLSFTTLRAITSPGHPRDEYALSGGGGGLDIGWVVVNDAGTLITPFVQAGYYGYRLDYTNNQIDPIPFFEGRPVASGSTASYTGAAPRGALGLSLTRLLGADPSSSVAPVLHVRLSWGTMLARPRWQEPDGGDVNNGGLTPAYNGVALSIQVGGGGRH